ncbi:O-methyltransferase [Lacihabitans sp. CCS-44]|uniref:O-methyltransferase n=1 Tax=Lacihabitans sp. CCS-44 TaxID=2487331 RepID=UPI0020CFC09D|nr:class I SAM-dependent methyltransferase [Lacihabitans sp. CCS-44]
MEDEVQLFNQLPEEEKIGRKDDFLLPIGFEIGVFLNNMIKSAKSKTILEIGTAYGYSTIWLAEAAKATGGKVITLEISQEKVNYAKDKIGEAELSDYVEFRVGNALESIKNATETFDFVLLDIWKELYTPCFELFFPKLNIGAWVAADNIIHPPHHKNETDKYLIALKQTNAFDSVLLPIGSGIELSQLK